MKSKFITLLFCTVIAGTSAFSQIISPLFKENILPKKNKSSALKVNNYIPPIVSVSPKFYSSNLAFFCRQEIKFEKTTKIPLKLRLGSVQQVDYLEGKNNFRP